MRSVSLSTELVLLGAGHAHVEVLRRAAMRPMPGVRLTLIAREPHTPYSGMLPGLLRGEYRFDDAHVDCGPLAAAAGARLIVAEADAIDLPAGAVRIGGRPLLPFDLLSVDVGGVPAMPDAGGVAVKPIGRFLAHLAALEERLAPDDRIAVIGAGAGGVELALALAHRLRRRARIVLIGREAAPLPGAPARARAVVQAALETAGVDWVGGVDAGPLQRGRLDLSDGRVLAVAEALWATGVVGPGFLAASGLPCDAAGCLIVDATLRSTGDARVFAAGDCASLRGDPRPKAGVWAVRAGGVLADNLGRAAASRPLRRWRPQRAALVILGLGDGRAVAWRNGFTLAGRAAWRWKDRIDRRWMRMYARLRPMPMAAEDMRCAGCGAKVPAATLSAVLGGLPAATECGISLGVGDDAAVALPPPGMAVVQSVDQFRAFLDDLFVFGEIAAVHALSDLHAMGARPWTALAVATVPNLPGRMMGADLEAMLQGAAGALRQEGCVLVGGHSAEGAEAALGFAVTGLAAPEAVWRKAGLRAGDALLLTKPLGTGIVLAAQMRGLAKARWLQAAVASMRRSNGPAAAVLRGFGVTACTDVTGFGLGGHLREMLAASGVGAVLHAAALPALPGVAELIAAGVQSSLAPSNRLGLPDHPAAALLADPQTSGGLLAGVPADRAEACLLALQMAGIAAALVGHAEPGGLLRIG